MRARSRSDPVISERPSTQKDDVCDALRSANSASSMENLGGDILLILDDDSAGIDQFEAAGLRVSACPWMRSRVMPGFVADDGAPLSGNSIEECGLSNVGPAHNDHCGNGGIGHVHSIIAGWFMVMFWI